MVRKARTSRAGGGALSLLLLFLTTAATAAPATVKVTIESPDSRTPIFGQVEVVVRVYSIDPVDRVELEVDGRPAGVLRQAPFRFRIDVGDDNVSHRLEAVAIDSAGVRATAVRQTPRLKIHEVVDLDLQQAYVTVTGRGSRGVLGLSRRDFELYDEGRRQEIITFESGDVPFTAVLLIDASRSMQGRPLAAARLGAQSFVDGMKDFDETAVVAFSDRLLLAAEFSASSEHLDAELGPVEAAGGTAIHDFLFFALRRLESRQGRRVVVLLSHGRDVYSVLRMHQVRDVARRSQAQIYWIRIVTEYGPGLGIDSWRGSGANRRQARQLEATVKESGGRILEVTGKEIEPAVAEVLQELRDQYAVGYYPSEDLDDGSWRQLKVKLRRSGLTARTSGGYLDY